MISAPQTHLKGTKFRILLPFQLPPHPFSGPVILPLHAHNKQRIQRIHNLVSHPTRLGEIASRLGDRVKLVRSPCVLRVGLPRVFRSFEDGISAVCVGEQRGVERRWRFKGAEFGEFGVIIRERGCTIYR